MGLFPPADDGVVRRVFFRHNTEMTVDANERTSLESPWVVITRALNDAEDFVVPLQAQGYSVAGVPLITSSPMAFAQPLKPYDWLVFTSRWGIQHYFQQGGIVPANAKLAVVGNKAKAFLEQEGYTVSLVAEDGTSQSLAKSLLTQSTQPHRVLWPCGDRALHEWTQPLAERGWTVDPVVVYQTQLRTRLTPEELTACQQADVIVITSPSCAQALFEGLRHSNALLNSDTQLVALGPTTQQALMEHGGRCSGVALPHTLAGAATWVLSSCLPKPQTNT